MRYEGTGRPGLGRDADMFPVDLAALKWMLMLYTNDQLREYAEVVEIEKKSRGM